MYGLQKCKEIFKNINYNVSSDYRFEYNNDLPKMSVIWSYKI